MELWMIFAAVVLGFGALCFFNWWTHRGPTLTGPATVVSRRVEHGRASGGRYAGSNNWNYYITFRLLDGEEIELSAMEYWFQTLREGMTGQLKWNGEQLYDFECDEVTQMD